MSRDQQNIYGDHGHVDMENLSLREGWLGQEALVSLGTLGYVVHGELLDKLDHDGFEEMHDT
jgi:hypothetical protein